VRQALRDAGIEIRDLRVRDLGDHASIEVDAAAVGPAAETPAVVAAALAAGFDTAAVDPRGFRSGSMNERLPDPERFR
jgi:pyridinium-3,5-biscarboxylic acid mononucleotide sulfurtransferase